MKSGIDNARTAFAGLGFIALLAFVLLIIFGNLSGNDGFAANSAGANNTAQVINNYTGGLVSFFSFQNVIFVLLAIALLVSVAVGLMKLLDSKGGFAN